MFNKAHGPYAMKIHMLQLADELTKLRPCLTTLIEFPFCWLMLRAHFWGASERESHVLLPFEH